MKIKEENAEIEITALDEEDVFIISMKNIDILNNTQLIDLKQKFNNVFKFKHKILSYDNLEHYYARNTFIESCGFKIFKKTIVFKCDLTTFSYKNTSKLMFKDAGLINEIEFKNLISKITHKEANESWLKGTDEIVKGMIKNAGFNYSIDNWKIVFLNDVIIGLVCPQMYPDDSKEGSIFFIGVLSEYRNKGYGTIIHAMGLNFLTKMGATKYIGSTTSTNNTMVKVFHNNNIKESYTKIYYGFD